MHWSPSACPQCWLSSFWRTRDPVDVGRQIEKIAFENAPWPKKTHWKSLKWWMMLSDLHYVVSIERLFSRHVWTWKYVIWFDNFFSILADGQMVNCTNNVTRRHHKLNLTFFSWTSIFKIRPFTVTKVKFRKIRNMDPKQTRKARSFLRQGLFPFQNWRLRGQLPFTVEKIGFTSIYIICDQLHRTRQHGSCFIDSSSNAAKLHRLEHS